MLDIEDKKRIVREELQRIEEHLFRIEVELVANQNNPDYARVPDGMPPGAISQHAAMVKAKQTLHNMKIDLEKRYGDLFKEKSPRVRKIPAEVVEMEPEAALEIVQGSRNRRR